MRATWAAIAELADEVAELLARAGAPPVTEGTGIRTVRALDAAAKAGRRDESFWEERLRRPRTDSTSWPTPVVFDANVMDGQPVRSRLAGSEAGKALDKLTGADGGRR